MRQRHRLPLRRLDCRWITLRARHLFERIRAAILGVRRHPVPAPIRHTDPRQGGRHDGR